jgi:hypothetical protein
VKLNLPAFTAYRRDAATQAAVASEAERLAERANALHVTEGAEYAATAARDSANGTTALVSTGNYEARIDQASHNTLLKALGGG